MSKTTEEIEIRFRDGLISSQLIETESSGLLAVSGGIDSVVMAYLFGQVRDNLGLLLLLLISITPSGVGNRMQMRILLKIWRKHWVCHSFQKNGRH